MLSRIGKLVGGSAAAATVALALAPVALAASLPKAVDFWGMEPVDGLAVRPAGLGWTTDLGPLFNGPRGSTNNGRGPNSSLSWSSWGANGANGSGDLWVPRERGLNVSWKRYPATLSFSAPKTLTFRTQLNTATYRAELVFTRLAVSFTGAVPAHWRRSASFPMKKFSKDFYGFDVPS
jgi:hypothetical protein